MTRSPNQSERRLWLIILGAALIVISLAIGVFSWWRLQVKSEVKASLQRIKAAGLPTSGAELDKWYASVPDPQNAALVLTQAFGLMRFYPDRRSNDIAALKLPHRGEPLTAEQRELLEPYLNMNRAALAKARAAIELSKSRYPVNLTAGFDGPLPHLLKLQRLARAAELNVTLLAESGRPVEAATDTITLLALARSLDEEPVAISQMLRSAFVKMAVAALERTLASGEIHESELIRLANAFAIAEKTNLVQRALIGERAMAIPYFRMSAAEMRRRSNKKPHDEEIATKPPLPGLPPLIIEATGFFERDLRFYLNVMETNIALSGLAPPETLAATNLAREIDREIDRKRYVLCAMFLTALPKLSLREAEALAHVRTARTVVAIERFRRARGRLPKPANEIVSDFLPALPLDPFDGAPIRFRQLPNGYVVYSVGLDRRDDGGREPRPKASRSEPQDITITMEK